MNSYVRLDVHPTTPISFRTAVQVQQSLQIGGFQSALGTTVRILRGPESVRLDQLEGGQSLLSPIVVGPARFLTLMQI